MNTKLYISTEQTETDIIESILGNSNFANPIFAHLNTTGTGGNQFIQAFESAGHVPIIGEWKSFSRPLQSATTTPTIVNGAVEIEIPTGKTQTSATLYQYVLCDANTDYELQYTIVSNNTTVTDIIQRGQMTFPYFDANNNMALTSDFGNETTPPTNITALAVTDAVGTHTYTITTQPTQTFAVFYLDFVLIGTAGEKIVIKDITLRKSSSAVVTITDDKFKAVDLYKEENIPLVFNVENFTNATEKVANYSKNFTIPASKYNNKLMDHVFDVTVDSDFMVHRKTAAYVTQNSVTIFEGYMRLLGIKKQGNEMSYEINLFDNTISLKDTLGDLTLGDIDLSELDHNYNIANIYNGYNGVLQVNTALPSGTHAGVPGSTNTSVLFYPVCNWTGNVQTASNFVYADRLEHIYRPWIKVRYLWDRIMENAGFQWDSASPTNKFKFNSDFNDLFMDMSWGSDTNLSIGSYFTFATASHLTTNNGNAGNPFSFQLFSVNQSGGINNTNVFAEGLIFNLGTSYTKIPLDNESPATTGWDPSTFEYTAPIDVTVNVSYSFMFYGEFKNDTVTFRGRHNSSNASNPSDPFDQSSHTFIFSTETGARGKKQFSGFVTLELSAGEKFWFEAKKGSGDSIFMMCDMLTGLGQHSHVNFANIDETSTGISASNLMLRERGKIKQWDFIKSFIDRFNLVVALDKTQENYLYFDTYKDWIESGQELSWTNKVDDKELDIKPITDLKKSIVYNDTLDEDFHNQDYFDTIREINGQATWSDPNNNLSTDTDNVTTFFTPNIFVKHANTSTFADAIWTHCYQVNEDGTTTDFSSAPRLGYKQNFQLSNAYIYTYPQNGGASQSHNNISVCSPVNSSGSFTINWGHPYNYFTTNTTPNDNVLTKYWLDYLQLLYDNSTRIVTAKIYLNEADILQFNFADKVRIKNRYYRVNKIEYNAGNLSKVELILLQ